VTVEPGVTQAQLFEFLREQGSAHWIDATGSTPGASLIGNIMERGFGVTPYGDHVGRACGYHVVLADGRLLTTGFGAWPGARTAPIDRWGPGPSLDGLFSQTGFGIVTQLSVALMPAPESALVCFFSLPDEAQLAAAVDTMRRLQLEATVRSAPWFGNVYRLLGVVMRFPWSQAEPPLRPEQAMRIAHRAGIAAWNGSVALYGTPAQVAASRTRVRRALSEIGVGARFVDSVALAAAPVTGRRAVELAMYRGYTGGLINAVRRAYWRKRTPPGTDTDLDRDGVGFIFVNASVPFRGDDVVRAARIAEEVVLRHGFEPSLSCHSVRERVLTMLMTVAYDREVAGQDDAAQAMHDDLARHWMDEGWYQFRLGLHSMHLFEAADPVYRDIVTAITQALDPSGVIAPGRYR
jgi:4-cresol dehydrogenase (hydroxylating)